MNCVKSRCLRRLLSLHEESAAFSLKDEKAEQPHSWLHIIQTISKQANYPRGRAEAGEIERYTQCPFKCPQIQDNDKYVDRFWKCPANYISLFSKAFLKYFSP